MAAELLAATQPPAGSMHAPRPKVDRNGLEILDEAACLRLLASVSIARVAYIRSDRAVVVPVNLAIIDGSVLFRVGTGALLRAIMDRRILTVEADRVDDVRGSAWSVLVHGVAHEVDRIPGRDLPAVRSWLRPEAARLVRIAPVEISGRRFIHD